MYTNELNYRVFHYFNVGVCRLSFYGQVLKKLNTATKIMYTSTLLCLALLYFSVLLIVSCYT